LRILGATISDKHAADKTLAEETRKRIITKDSTLGETAAADAWAAMKAKTKIGISMKLKKKK